MMKLVLIRPGKFMMGSPDSEQGRESKEGPQHEVVITKPFYMGVTEVTQAQYEAVMGMNPSKFTGPTNPVEYVSWDDAVLFCRKLSEKTGKTARLPTEAEWEYACRAGTKTRFSFGDSDSVLGDYAWWESNCGGKTHPVGQKKPNPWGLYDMHGNVWEWCADRYGSYSSGVSTDPQGATSGDRRLVRGRSWRDDGPGDFRCAARHVIGPAYRGDDRGFRVAMSLAGADSTAMKPVSATTSPVAPSAPSSPSLKKGEWIDLLALVQPGKDPSVGEWKRDGKFLVGAGIGAIGTPIALPGSYEVEVGFVRTNGKEALLFYLPCGPSAIRLVVGNPVGGGLSRVNGTGFTGNAAYFPGGQIETGRDYTLGIRVRVGTDAEITVLLDGKPYTHWRGAPSSLSVVDKPRDLHDPRIFVCGRDEISVVFKSLRLRVISGDATPTRPLGAAAPGGKP